MRERARTTPVGIVEGEHTAAAHYETESQKVIRPTLNDSRQLKGHQKGTYDFLAQASKRDPKGHAIAEIPAQTQTHTHTQLHT